MGVWHKSRFAQIDVSRVKNAGRCNVARISMPWIKMRLSVYTFPPPHEGVARRSDARSATVSMCKAQRICCVHACKVQHVCCAHARCL